MEFQIAGVRFRVVGDAKADDSGHDPAAAMVRERYAAYVSPPALPAARRVELRVSSAEIARDASRTGADVTYERRGDRVDVTRLDFRGTIDLGAGRVDVAFAGIGGLQSFLRIACSVLLAPLGGMLVHSCSVLRGARAFLFVGESGAGKTTIARLSAPSLILSDEVSAILPLGPDGFACHATPFWGDLADDLDDEGRAVTLREQPAGAPLTRILFPRKDVSDAVVPVSATAAFMELTREAFAFGDDEATMALISGTCERLSRAVPASELHFRKSPDFWSCLDA